MLWILGAFLCVYTLIYILVLLFFDCGLNLAFHEKFGKSIGHLRGKVVFVTGASSGIGEYTAYALAKHGVKLILAARRTMELERVKQNCLELSMGALGQEDILVLEMDMRNFSLHKQYINKAIEHFGHVDILFNNAGRSQRGKWEKIAIDVDKDLFELNVFSVINLTRVAIEYFNKRGEGHIAVTSSIAGVFGLPYCASYAGAKHALHGYMNALRNEKYGTGIDVSLICPGPVFTDGLQNSFTEKPSEKFGIKAQATDKRMCAKRCGELCAISIANKIKESWMGLFPFLPLFYCSVYFPQLFYLLLTSIGPEALYKIRDSRKFDF